MSRYLLKFKLDSPSVRSIFGDKLRDIYHLPDLKDTNIKNKEAKNIYTSLFRNLEISKANDKSVSNTQESLPSGFAVVEGEEIMCSYEDSDVQTYKLFGMDVGEDFCSYVKSYSGSFQVYNLYNPDWILSLNIKVRRSDNTFISDNLVSEVANSVFGSSAGYDIARAVATAMKCGGLYQMQKEIDSNDSSRTVQEILGSSIFSDIVRAYTEDNSSEDNNTVLPDSVVYNIVKSKDEVIRDSKGDLGGNDVPLIVLKYLFTYWGIVADNYARIKGALGTIDTLSYIMRLQLGDKKFFKDFRDCYEIYENDESSLDNEDFSSAKLLDKVTSSVSVSFGGISINIPYYDYPINCPAFEALKNIDITSSFRDVMESNVDMYDTFDLVDTIDMSDEEVQAMANIDALRYMDNGESTFNISSYDMSNEEERSLFFESAIKTYDKKLKVYKPEKNNAVVNSLFDVIERGSLESLKLMPVSDTVDGSDNVVNLTGTELQLQADKKVLRRVLMLVSKLSAKLLKQFL